MGRCTRAAKRPLGEFRVVWEIGVAAGSPQVAAEQALAIQRDPASSATVFDVVDRAGRHRRIDLAAPHRRRETALRSYTWKLRHGS